MRIALALLSLATFVAPAQAAPPAGETRVVYHGHAAFEIVTPSGKTLWVDPWLSNPLAGKKDPVADVKSGDYILVTHGHFDHVGDSVALAKKTGAKLVATYELGANMVRLLGFPANQMGFDALGGPGGEITVGNGEVTIDFVEAVHGSGLDSPEREKAHQPIAYGGPAVGFVIRVKGGPTIYHTGDTAYYGDMADIGKRFPPDLALVNIGGHFGMEPPEAARAAKTVKAKLVVPMHYKTMPVLTQSAAGFFKDLDAQHIAHRELNVGDAVVFVGNKPKK